MYVYKERVSKVVFGGKATHFMHTCLVFALLKLEMSMQADVKEIRFALHCFME